MIKKVLKLVYDIVSCLESNFSIFLKNLRNNQKNPIFFKKVYASLVYQNNIKKLFKQYT